MKVTVGFIFPHKDSKIYHPYNDIPDNATFRDLMQHILWHSPASINEEIDKVGGNSAKILAGEGPGPTCHHWKVKERNNNVTCIILPPDPICNIQGGGLIKKKKMKKKNHKTKKKKYKTKKKKYKKNKTKKRKY